MKDTGFNHMEEGNWQLIARYLSGEMESSELKLFLERMNSSGENKELLLQVKNDWEKMENIKKTEHKFDTDKAWNNLYDKFEKDGLIEKEKDIFSLNIKRFIQIAAVFILGVAITSLFYLINSNDKNSGWQIADNYGNTEIKEVKLSDGSVIYMNADSKLYYPLHFEGDTRTVEFEGDAFFDIAKNASKPFIIKAKKAEVKVLGTSFNINTNLGKDEVEVFVETGKVQLSGLRKELKPITIEPGYIGKLQNNQFFKYQNSDLNYMSWKTKIFNFENVNLGKVIEILNRAYHTNIQCNGSITDETRMYARFNNVKFDTILLILCDTYNLKQIKDSNGIILTPQ